MFNAYLIHIHLATGIELRPRTQGNISCDMISVQHKQQLELEHLNVNCHKLDNDNGGGTTVISTMDGNRATMSSKYVTLSYFSNYCYLINYKPLP